MAGAVRKPKRPDKKAILPEMVQLVSAGVSYEKIAERYNISKTSAYRWIQNKLAEDFQIGNEKALHLMSARVQDHYATMRQLMAQLQTLIKPNQTDIDSITKLVNSIARLNNEGVKLLTFQADLLGLRAAKKLEVSVTLMTKLQKTCEDMNVPIEDVVNEFILELKEAQQEALLLDD